MNKFPRYACFGNGYDTWEVDILRGNRHVENVASFKTVQLGKKWKIDIFADNKRTIRKAKIKLRGHTGSMSEEQLERNAVYEEAKILALSHISELKENERLL